jgi:hypothetical protein
MQFVQAIIGNIMALFVNVDNINVQECQPATKTKNELIPNQVQHQRRKVPRIFGKINNCSELCFRCKQNLAEYIAGYNSFIDPSAEIYCGECLHK